MYTHIPHLLFFGGLNVGNLKNIISPTVLLSSSLKVSIPRGPFASKFSCEMKPTYVNFERLRMLDTLDDSTIGPKLATAAGVTAGGVTRGHFIPFQVSALANNLNHSNHS